MGIDREFTHSVLGIVGNIASCLFFLSSAPTVIAIVRCKSTGDLSGDLYVFKLFNCMLWTFYGLPFVHPHDFWVLLTNSFGCAFSIMYIIPYLCFASRTQRVGLLWTLFAIVSGFIIMVVLLLLLDHSQTNRILVVGIMCVVVSSGMHTALLTQCRMALESMDAKYLHPYASVAAFFKGAIWIAYGIVNFDIFIVIPNGVGVLIGVIEVVIVVLLTRKRSQGIDLSAESCDDIDIIKGPKRSSIDFTHLQSTFLGLEVDDIIKGSTRNSMDKGSKRISMDKGSKRDSMEFMRLDKGTKRNSMEFVRLESTNLDLEREYCEQTQAGVTPPSTVSRVSPLLGLPRQGSVSSVVVPIFIDDDNAKVSTIQVV